MFKTGIHAAMLTLLFAGCSRSGSPTADAVGGTTTVAAVLPSLTGGTSNPSSSAPVETASSTGASMNSNTESPTSTPAAVSPFSEALDLFAPPKVAAPVTLEPDPEPEPTPEPVIETPKKHVAFQKPRLVGFAEVDGLKALLSVEGELNVVTVGDSPGNLHVIAIEPPLITLKYGQDGDQFQMNLYEQEWFPPTGAAGEHKTFGGKPVSHKSPSTPNSIAAPPIPGTFAPPSGSAPFGAPTPITGSSPPNVPGFGPVGAPGFHSSGLPNIPESNLKKNSNPNDNSGNANKGIPDIPRLPDGSPGPTPVPAK